MRSLYTVTGSTMSATASDTTDGAERWIVGAGGVTGAAAMTAAAVKATPAVTTGRMVSSTVQQFTPLCSNWCRIEAEIFPGVTRTGGGHRCAMR